MIWFSRPPAAFAEPEDFQRRLAEVGLPELLVVPNWRGQFLTDIYLRET